MGDIEKKGLLWDMGAEKRDQKAGKSQSNRTLGITMMGSKPGNRRLPHKTNLHYKGWKKWDHEEGSPGVVKGLGTPHEWLECCFPL